jgi:hypothetical protein
VKPLREIHAKPSKSLMFMSIAFDSILDGTSQIKSDTREAEPRPLTAIGLANVLTKRDVILRVRDMMRQRNQESNTRSRKENEHGG